MKERDELNMNTNYVKYNRMVQNIDGLHQKQQQQSQYDDEQKLNVKNNNK